MKLHNTLTRQTQDFEPIKAGEVSIYSCGPTAYDHAQIGNLRTYIFDDLLRRVLRSQGYRVTHVINITDVDDKTIKRSRERYPDDDPKEALQKLTREYEMAFLADALKLGIDYSKSTVARATEHIGQMQQLINTIPNKYVSDDGIYFDIAKDKDYGVLIKLDTAHEQHRINNDEYDKEHAADFALWKAQDGDEPAWAFELDSKNIAGRPGWHIECSAMSTHYLGQPFDIHTGGVDLIFPHHENEIAQSRAAHGQPLANYFVHGEHLLVDGRKMSKSLKNFYTVADIVEKGFEPLAFRLLVLQSHYRSQMNFSWESLAAAQTNLLSLYAWADQKFQPGVPRLSDEVVAAFKKEFEDDLTDDLNSPAALAELNGLIDKGAPDGALLEYLDKILGLGLSGRNDITDEQKALIEERQNSRQSQDWSKSDQLRDQLKEHGIEINDTDQGPVWSRVSSWPFGCGSDLPAES